MIEEHKETAKLSIAGIAAVLITGLIVWFLAPDNETGRMIKFFSPLLVGLAFGAKIYLKELEKVKKKVQGED